jgi:hypothetical protein
MNYRRNADARVRKLERAALSGDWHAKLALNAVMVRQRQVPPPDVDIEIMWTEESVLEFSGEMMRHYPGAVREWSPSVGDVKERWRRWYFPGGFGVSAHYDERYPLPGWLPIPVSIPREEHGMDAPLFRWDEANLRSPGDDYPGAIRIGGVVRAWPHGGAPAVSDASYRTSPRPLRNSDHELLEIMRMAASASKAGPDREIWTGTDWDWWTEMGENPPHYRRNADERERRLEREAAAGDHGARRRLLIENLRAGRIDYVTAVGLAVRDEGPIMGWTPTWDYPGFLSLEPPVDGWNVALVSGPWHERDGTSFSSLSISFEDHGHQMPLRDLFTPDTGDVFDDAENYREQLAGAIMSIGVAGAAMLVGSVDHQEAEDRLWQGLRGGP